MYVNEPPKVSLLQFLKIYPKKLKFLLFIMIISIISSCASVGPDFIKPEIPAPEGWLEKSDELDNSNNKVCHDWWKNFNDPDLEALINKAHSNSQTLEIAGLRIHEARARLGIAVGALYPQSVNLGAAADHIRLSENAEPVSYLPSQVKKAVNTDFNNYHFGFNTIWELDFWGKYRRIIEAADASLAAKISAYDTMLVTLSGEVANAYIILRTLEERIKVLRTNADIQKRSAEISGVRHRNQITSELDVVQAQVQLKNTQASIPKLTALLKETENALSLLIGAAPGEVRKIISPESNIPTPPLLVGVGIPADLLRRRPDIRKAEYMAAFHSAGIGIAKSQLYPSFKLRGSIGLSTENMDDFFDSDSISSILGTGVSWNIFNFGRIKNLIRANDARFQQALVNYEIVVLNAFREVETAQSGFLEAKKEVILMEESQQMAKRAVDLALIQYRDGISDFTRVLTAQQALMLQQDRLVDARGRMARHLVDLYRALGGGWKVQVQDNFIPLKTKDQMEKRTNWGNLLQIKAVQP